jgi:hypothetical protein
LNNVWIGSAVAAILATSPERLPANAGERVFDRVLITARTGRPPLSGYERSWIALRVLTPDARQLDMYMSYRTEDQFIPPPYSYCRVRFHAEPGIGVTSERSIPRHSEIQVIDELSCEGGRFVMPR